MSLGNRRELEVAGVRTLSENNWGKLRPGAVGSRGVNSLVLGGPGLLHALKMIL